MLTAKQARTLAERNILDQINKADPEIINKINKFIQSQVDYGFGSINISLDLDRDLEKLIEKYLTLLGYSVTIGKRHIGIRWI